MRRAVAVAAVSLAVWSIGCAASDATVAPPGAAAGVPPARQAALVTQERQQALVTQERQQALVRMVRHDCGACHGMRLTGGLGPALTPQALADKPLDSMVATVVHGRPGTPMPPWRAMLDDAEARWIVEQLMRGFPELPGGSSAVSAR